MWCSLYPKDNITLISDYSDQIYCSLRLIYETIIMKKHYWKLLHY